MEVGRFTIPPIRAKLGRAEPVGVTGPRVLLVTEPRKLRHVKHGV